MKTKIIILISALLLSAGTLRGQNDPSLHIGSKSAPFVYTHTINTSAASDPFFYYRFTLTTALDVKISNCGSTVSETGLFLLDEMGDYIEIATFPGNCSNPGLSSLETSKLQPGTYEVLVDWVGNGSVITTIEGDYPQTTIPVGGTIDTAILAGSYSFSFAYTDIKNTNDFQGNFAGKNIYYQFTLSKRMEVEISHCGSSVANTYLLLLNNQRNTIAENNDYSGVNACSNLNLSYLKIMLDAGTYYVVSSTTSASDNGLLRTYISGTTPELGVGSSNRNYITTRTYTKEDQSAWLDKVDYFDELGRPEQSVQCGVSPTGKDQITLIEYDAFGRVQRTWLPTVLNNTNGTYVPIATVKYGSQSSNGNDPNPYSNPIYEQSPLNRIAEEYGPGQSWQSNRKGVKREYLTNNSSYNFKHYTVSVNSQGEISISCEGDYAAAQLYITRMTDENENLSYEITNKQGQVVLIRQMEGTNVHDTYYIYDCFGNMSVVLPPLAAEAFYCGTQTEGSDNLTKYAYLYKYDKRNRCIAKKLPGADWIFHIYDKADRLIFTQDGEMRNQGKWMFTIPDPFGRTSVTGTCTNSLNHATDPLGSTVVNAARNNAANTYKGYTVSGVPLSNPVLLSVNYYDDYAFMGKNGIPAITDTNFRPETVAGYGTQYGNCNGLLTGTMNFQMSPNSAITSALYSVMYYDYRGRLIQTKSSNHLGGIEKKYIAYNFMGQPTKRKQIHSATGKTTQTQLYEYVYDHAGRLSRVKHGLNGSTANTIIVENTYDELGRLKTHKKGALPPTTYGYNIRSWMKSISNSTLFSQTLYYDESYGGSERYYNGNVSAMSWKVGSETLGGYAFGYDGLSRLKWANYLQNGSINSNNSVSDITYDKHGNIKTQQRRGKVSANAYGVIDNLNFSYSGNQLMNVTDAGSTVALPESNDFKKGSADATTYAYNKNGAMTKDSNKKISAISYNLLNLPEQLTIDGVTHKYTYTADGQKLKIEQDSSNRDYAGSVIYENGSLKRILIEGGYIEGNTYYYYLNDHLGNTRVVASGMGTIIQKNHYYPFGMPMAETSSAEQDVQPYKFGAKEFDRKNGLNLYDYSARYMDPALGRFTTMDPMAEKYYGMSPYAYCGNNPMRFVDPTGMDWYSYEEEYEDQCGYFQIRTRYKYVEGTMPKNEVINGGYRHLGKSYMSGDTYYSIGGSEIKFDLLNPQSMNAMAMIKDADRSVFATIEAMEEVGDFWDKYNGVISTGSSAATVLSNYMEASKGVSATVTLIGVAIAFPTAVSDGQALLNGELKGMALMDAAMNVVSLAGAPGAAIGLSYSGSKEIAKGIGFMKKGSEVGMKRYINSIFSWMGTNQLIR